MLIRGIIFDVFGTLIQVTNGGTAKTIRQYLLEGGQTVEESEFLKRWKAYYQEAIQPDKPFQREAEIFCSRLKMFYHQYQIQRSAEADYGSFYRSACQRMIYPDVQPTLEQIRKKYALFLASNTDNDILEAVIHKNKIPIECRYTSEGFQCYKPDAAFYQKLLKQLPYPPSELIFVGDSLLEDVRMPREFGMSSILIDREGRYPSAYEPKISSFTELPDILEEMQIQLA